MIRRFASTFSRMSAVGLAVALLATVVPARWAQSRQEAPDAEPRVTFAHVAPFSGTVAGTGVAVLMDGKPVADAIYYLDGIADMELSPGNHTLAIDPNAWPGKEVKTSFDAVADLDVTYALIGGTGDVALQIVAYLDDPVGDPENAKVRFHNFAPVAFSGDSETTLCNENDEPFLNMDSAIFSHSTAYTITPPGTYILHLSPTSTQCKTPVVTDFEVALDAGQVVDLYFTGLGTDAFPLTVVQYDQGLRRRWDYTAFLPTLLASGN